MSNLAWCGIDIKGDILNLLNLCPNPSCKLQKQVDFTSRQYQLEAAGFKNKLQIFSKGTTTT